MVIMRFSNTSDIPQSQLSNCWICRNCRLWGTITISQAQPATSFVQPFWVTASSAIPPLTLSASNTDISSIENNFKSFMLIIKMLIPTRIAFRILRLLYSLVCGIIVDFNLSLIITLLFLLLHTIHLPLCE